jgi:hypothetical protein
MRSQWESVVHVYELRMQYYAIPTVLLKNVFIHVTAVAFSAVVFKLDRFVFAIVIYLRLSITRMEVRKGIS